MRRKGQPTTAGWNTLFSDSGASFTATPRCRRIAGVTAAQLTSKAKVACALYTRETSLTEREGALVLYDSTTADWYDLGQEYSTTHYAATGQVAPHWRWIPLWRNNNTPAQPFRGISAADRRKILGGGGRAFVESGNWLFAQSESTPYMWRKEWNFATGSGTNKNRLRPWGSYPPLGYPFLQALGGTASVRSWKKGEMFYSAVLFLFEDGSASAVQLPSDDVADTHGSATLGAGGRFQLPTTTDYYEYVEWTCIPRGPKGTIARVLLRSTKIDVTGGVGAGAVAPAIKDLRVIAQLDNNTQTTYRDYAGNDDSLTIASEFVTVQHMWPRRARYIAGNDSRFALGGAVKVRADALLIAPLATVAQGTSGGSITGHNVNECADLTVTANPDPDDSTGIANKYFYYEITSTALKLYLYTSAGGASTLQTKTFTLANYTLEQLVIAINQTKLSVDSQEWCAALVPGADGTVTASWLSVTGTGGTDASTSCGDATREGVASGTAAIANDNSVWVRGPWEPAVLYFSQSYVNQYPADDQIVFFTKGGPDAVKSAPLAWAPYNRAKPPTNSVGRMQGLAGVGDKFIVAYENAIYVLRNTKSGNAGEDRDMRLAPLNPRMGCCAPGSVCEGDGVVGYLTPVGYKITDGEREVLLSRALWHQRKKIGEWAAGEMSLSKQSVAADTDDSFFAAAFMGDELHLTYRKVSSTAPDRRLVYDFSANAIASGVDSMLDPETRQPFGWSTPLKNTVSHMVDIPDANNQELRYGAVEGVAAGQIDKLDSGNVDGSATTIPAQANFRTDFGDTLDLKQLGQGRIMYTSADAAALTVSLYRDSARADSYDTTLSATTTSIYTRGIVDPDPAARTPCDVFEVKIVDDGTGATPSEIWQYEQEFKPLPNYPR